MQKALQYQDEHRICTKYTTDVSEAQPYTNYLISTISNSNDLFRRHHSLVAIIHALHFVDEDLLNLYKKGVATGLIHKYEK